MPAGPRCRNGCFTAPFSELDVLFICLFVYLFSFAGWTNSQNFVEEESTHELHPVIYFRTDLAAVGGVVGEESPISQYLPSEVVDGDFWIQSPRSDVERLSKGRRYTTLPYENNLTEVRGSKSLQVPGHVRNASRLGHAQNGVRNLPDLGDVERVEIGLEDVGVDSSPVVVDKTDKG